MTIGNLANGELCFSAGDVKLVDLTGTPLSIGSTVAISIFQTDDPTMSKLIVINSTGVVRAYSYDALATSTPQPTITPVPTLTPGPTSTSTPVPTPAGGIVHCNNGMDTWDCDPGCDCGLYFDECSNCPVVPTATPTEEGCIALGDPCSSSYDCCYGYCGYAGFQYECMLYSSPTPTATRTPTPTATRTPTPTPSIISCFDGYQDWECGGGCQCGQQYPDCDFCPYATPTLPASCSPLGDPCWYDYDCCSNFCDFNGFGYECAP